MTIKHKAGTTGQAAALPAPALVSDIEALASQSEAARRGLVDDVSPLLAAAENLADCHRVLRQLVDAADLDQTFGDAIKDAAPTFRNPTLTADPLELLQDLLRVASEALGRQVGQAEALNAGTAGLLRMARGEAP